MVSWELVKVCLHKHTLPGGPTDGSKVPEACNGGVGGGALARQQALNNGGTGCR